MKTVRGGINIMAYVKCHDCGRMVHFKPVDIVEFHKKFIEKNEPVYCFECFENKVVNHNFTAQRNYDS